MDSFFKTHPVLHDNARPHISRITQQKLNELGYEVLPHPLYSPDISPIDYHFFKHLDLFLREKLFSDERMIETAFQQFIESRNRQLFRNGIHSLVGRWQKCLDSQGTYFDKFTFFLQRYSILKFT